MIRTIADFEKRWQAESQSTQKIMAALTDKSLSQAVADDHRTLGRIAWHLVTTYGEMVPHTGLEITSVDPNAPVPASAEEIRRTHELAAREVLEQVKAKWDDAALAVEQEMYGDKWARGLTLDILIRHEVHHRGQMTVLMRQAGLKVPGVYGPSYEEWGNYGGQPPAV